MPKKQKQPRKPKKPELSNWPIKASKPKNSENQK